jgi:hypothetical protein
MMKINNSALLLSFILLSTISFSQNTFPSSGNVGIGTTSPLTNLHVKGTSNPLLVEVNASGTGIANTIGYEVSNSNATTGNWAGVFFTSSPGAGAAAIVGVKMVDRTNNYGDIGFGTRASDGFLERMRILANGNVGIGTTAPQGKFSVLNPLTTNVVTTLGLFGYSGSTDNRSISFQQIGNASTAHQYLFLNGGLGANSVVGTPTLTSSFAPSFGFECNDNNLNIITSSNGTNNTVKRAMSVSSNGNVGIGTTSVNDANYKLFVETGIRTRKVKVDVATWADYVFSPSYKLPSLKEVEQFIKQHKHLPDVPSEAEVKKEGLDLGENQVVLLKKIEELTLYIIEQNRNIDEQLKFNEALNNRLKKLEERKL